MGVERAGVENRYMEKEGQEESGLEKVCGSMVGNDQLPIGDNTFREKEMGQKETGGTSSGQREKV